MSGVDALVKLQADLLALSRAVKAVEGDRINRKGSRARIKCFLFRSPVTASRRHWCRASHDATGEECDGAHRTVDPRFGGPADDYFHVTSIPKKCMNFTIGLVLRFCCGLRM